LKRCYGIDKKIIDCDWDYLSQRQTLRAPHESMPRLIDLLTYLAKPGLQNIWLLLDIKVPSLASSPFPSMRPVLIAPKAHQQRRRYHAPHRHCRRLSPALLLCPLEPAHRPRHLVSKLLSISHSSQRVPDAWNRSHHHPLERHASRLNPSTQRRNADSEFYLGPQSSSPYARNTYLATQFRISASPYHMRAGSSICLIFASTHCNFRSWALAAGRISVTSRRKGGRY